jgi:hypothetical protein
MSLARVRGEDAAHVVERDVVVLIHASGGELDLEYGQILVIAEGAKGS